MRLKPLLLALIAFGLGALFSLPVFAQDSHSEISANFTGNFQKQTTGLDKTDTASYSGGFLSNYRYQFNSWSAIQVNYAYTSFSQYYSPGYTSESHGDDHITRASAHELTFAYVNTFGKSADVRIRPFVEAGTGVFIFSPTSKGSTVSGATQSRAVFLYGGGLDWRVTGNISVRLGYRGLIYTAPDFVVSVQTTNALTHMAEPYIGIVFHF